MGGAADLSPRTDAATSLDVASRRAPVGGGSGGMDRLGTGTAWGNDHHLRQAANGITDSPVGGPGTGCQNQRFGPVGGMGSARLVNGML